MWNFLWNGINLAVHTQNRVHSLLREPAFPLFPQVACAGHRVPLAGSCSSSDPRQVLCSDDVHMRCLVIYSVSCSKSLWSFVRMFGYLIFLKKKECLVDCMGACRWPYILMVTSVAAMHPHPLSPYVRPCEWRWPIQVCPPHRDKSIFFAFVHAACIRSYSQPNTILCEFIWNQGQLMRAKNTPCFSYHNSAKMKKGAPINSHHGRF